MNWGSGAGLPVHITEVECYGDEEHILDCPHGGFGRVFPCSKIAENWSASVRCHGNKVIKSLLTDKKVK